tara:strand:+ start:94 stop:813 length:720 start_codon:yes stop_codon:yes gene_type:complete
MDKTKLSWPEYKKEALKLKSRGLGFPKIYERLGLPVFKGVEYKLESDRGDIKRKTRAASRAGKLSSTNTRSTNQAISTPPDADTSAANRLVKQIRSTGGQADHKAELSRTGNAMRSMSEQRRQLMRSRMSPEIGHQEGNLQRLSAKDNLQKNLDYRRLDSHLRRLAKNPSVGKPMFGANLATLAISYLPVLDELTGNNIDSAYKKGLESLKITGQQVLDAAVSGMIQNRELGYDLNLGQ